MVVGYAMDDNYKTPLISRALRDAADRFPLRPGAIFHSDRGSNYTSGEFAATLTELGLRQSLGRTGICYDNAMAESFFAALKNERVHRTAYPTRAHARADIARYIEFWYNRNRLHSGLAYRTPQESLEAWTKDRKQPESNTIPRSENFGADRTPSLHIDYKHTAVKQYHKHGRALRTETTINDTRDFDSGRG